MFDATSLGHATCLLRFDRLVRGGYRPKVKTVNIVWGLAFHKFIERLRRGDELFNAIEKARELFDNTPKFIPSNMKHLDVNLLTFLAGMYNTAVFKTDPFKVVTVENEPLVELKFAIPFYESEQYEYLLCGTIDAILKASAYIIEDIKTTGGRNPDDYFSSYVLSTQLHVYAYAIRWYAQVHPGSVFDEIVSRNSIGCMINGIFHTTKMTECLLKRSPVFYISNDAVDRFAKHTLTFIKRYDEMLRSNQIEDYKEGLVNGSCEEFRFGKCPYFGVCSAPDAVASDMVLRQHFEQRAYNPLKFNED